MKEISKVFDEEIVGQNVTLKKYDISYKDEFKKFILENYKHIFEFTNWTNTLKTDADIDEFFYNTLKLWKYSRSAAYMILEKQTEKFIGNIKMFIWDKNVGEISIWLGKDFSGSGYGNEAFNLLICNFFEKDFDTIGACVNIRNKRSKKLLEKNGFEKLKDSFSGKSVYETYMLQR